jgi:transposase
VIPRAVREWKRRRYPALKREALAAGAEILFLDETGFRADGQMGRTWGAKGRTPVVERDGRRPSAFYWEVFRGTFTSARFAGFLERFMKRRKGPVVIVLDNHPVHVSKAVVRLAERSEDRLRLEYLPAYGPELNAREQAWRYAKRTGTSRNPLREGESISERAERDLEAMQRKPRLIRSFFEKPDTVYVHEAA